MVGFIDNKDEFTMILIIDFFFNKKLHHSQLIYISCLKKILKFILLFRKIKIFLL